MRTGIEAETQEVISATIVIKVTTTTMVVDTSIATMKTRVDIRTNTEVGEEEIIVAEVDPSAVKTHSSGMRIQEALRCTNAKMNNDR